MSKDSDRSVSKDVSGLGKEATGKVIGEATEKKVGNIQKEKPAETAMKAK